MTREEAIEKLKAKLECMERDVSGRFDDCNSKLCSECHLNYEMGTMGEQKDYLRMAIKALYDIRLVSQALHDITQWECCDYGYRDACNIADEYVESEE